MTKKGTYIRTFTPKQRSQMQFVATEQRLKTAPSILFFALENYIEQQKEIARLKRIINYKQTKIEKLQTTPPVL